VTDPADAIPVAFGRVLRAMGLDVPVGSVVLFAQALGAMGLSDRDLVYWAGRATLLRKPEDVPAYDAAFHAFWHQPPPAHAAPPPPPMIEEEADTAEEGGARFSPYELLRQKDFAAYSHEEFAEARWLMADLRVAGALRRSRRLQPAPPTSHAGRPDLRRTVRRSLRTTGEPVHRARLERSQQHRRLILLLDVSGSMEPYARALVRFLHAAVVGRRRVEAFALGTRVTRITRELQWRDPDAAIAAAAKRVVDWSGGTRLGEGLRVFNDEWGVRGMARGATVVVLSDGWDRGDPDLLGREMARLQRVAHRLVWVNPLKASPGYEPLARGMAAALPYVDDFVEGHSLAALQRLAEVIKR
jgi:uncharacterized protein with von Willebrand factor type A (vWA) domain